MVKRWLFISFAVVVAVLIAGTWITHPPLDSGQWATWVAASATVFAFMMAAGIATDQWRTALSERMRDKEEALLVVDAYLQAALAAVQLLTKGSHSGGASAAFDILEAPRVIRLDQVLSELRSINAQNLPFADVARVLLDVKVESESTRIRLPKEVHEYVLSKRTQLNDLEQLLETASRVVHRGIARCRREANPGFFRT